MSLCPRVPRRFGRVGKILLLMVGTVSMLLGIALPSASAAPATAAQNHAGRHTFSLSRPVVIGFVRVSSDIDVLSQDGEGTALTRIDPATNRVVAARALPSGSASCNNFNVSDLALANGSLWVALCFRNVVLRLDPQTLAETGRITTGRSPTGIVAGGGSLWTPLAADHAVQQIDPRSAQSVGRIPLGNPKQFIDQPFSISWNGTDLLVPLPVNGRVAHIRPGHGVVGYDQVGKQAAACPRVLPISGGYWLDDTLCSVSYYRWTAGRQRVTATATPNRSDFGAIVVGGRLYTGEADCSPQSGCTRGYLVQRNGTTGVVTGQQVIGHEAFLPWSAAGSFWTNDVDAGLLQRTPAF